MKRISILLIAILLAFQTKAQIKLGAQAGVNFASITAFDKINNEKTDISSRTLYQVGATAEFQVIPLFSIETGVQYGKYGSKWNDAEQNNIKLTYLKFPITFLSRYPLGIGTLKFGTGVYYALALNGQLEKNGLEEELAFGTEPNAMFSKPDFGLDFRTAYELKNGLSMKLNYQLGLRNIASPAQSEFFSFKNRAFSIGLGYLIKL